MRFRSFSELYKNAKLSYSGKYHQITRHAIAGECLLDRFAIGDWGFSVTVLQYPNLTNELSSNADAGVNAVYQEKISNIRREETFEEDATTVLIVTELAGFGDGGALKRFTTEFDKRLDRISEAPGQQIYEKFVGGIYLGELVRQILKLLTERGQLFGGVWPASLRGYKSFKPGFLCEIDRDPPHNFYSTEFLLKEDLKIHNLTPEDIHIVRYVCDAVIYRAACLTASAAVTILKRINRLRVTIGVDGYMFRQHPTFYKQMLKIMTDLIPKHMTFRMKLAGENYPLGAAAVAALYKDFQE